MDNLEKLRKAIRAEIHKHLQEMSTTGNVAGYLTPRAFLGDKEHGTERIKQMAKAIGYSLTDRGKRDIRAGDKLEESVISDKLKLLKENVKVLVENYYEYRNDPTHKPHQKIGMAISEVNKQLKVIEKVLRMNSRLQKEYGVSNDKLWKRTTSQMLKLESRLLELAGRLREMRG